MLFLQLDGVQIDKGTLSDAPTNQSYVCGGTFPAWDERPFGASRADAVAQLRSQVAALFADFNLQVVTERPAAPPYDMVVVGGAASICDRPDGLGGLGPLDCSNADLSDIAFVFGASITAMEGLAVVIAHEAGHTWGLPHTANACDIMSSFWCSGGSKRFLDQEMAVVGDTVASCGLQTSNSWQKLREILGPTQRPVADATTLAPNDAGQQERLDSSLSEPAQDAAGCVVGGARRSSLSATSLLILGLIGLLGIAMRRHCAVESTNGPSRRDQLSHW